MGIGGVLAADRHQLREPIRIPAAGHLGGQDLHRSWCQKPGQARPDHVTADQHENGAAQSVEVVFLPCAGRAVAPQPPNYAVPPSDVPGHVGAADQPPVLPSLPGIVLQPAQDLSDAGATAGLLPGASRTNGGASSRADTSSPDCSVADQLDSGRRGGNCLSSPAAAGPSRRPVRAVVRVCAVTLCPARTEHSASPADTRPSAGPRPRTVAQPGPRGGHGGRAPR